MSVPLAFQAIQRLCHLQDRVAREAVGYDHAADCFCGHGGFWPIASAESYRNEFKAIEFIEQAVDDAIAKRKAVA